MPTPAQLIKDIEAGRYDEAFARLYCGEEHIPAQRARYTEALREFEGLYGAKENVAVYSTPGRTEIGGNHTDHQNGKVLAAGVNLDIIAVAAPSGDKHVHVKSKGFSQADSVDVEYLEPVNEEFGRSAALIRGVAAAVVQRGGAVGGFDAYTTNNVLRGSGLSSSAAFEVCMGSIFNDMYNDNRFTAVELGQIGQYAENKFFGKPSGLMDQTACAVGSAITIDFGDPEAPVVEKLPFHLDRFGYKLVITDTKGSHAGLTDEYAAVRTDMERVATYFKAKVLREVPEGELLANIADVRRFTGDRAILRALHFYSDCRRVEGEKEAILAGDFERFKQLVIESGNSSFEYNQNAYSVKAVQEQGVPLGLCLSQTVLNGKGAWRLQGGGFAGTIQAFVPDALCEEYCQRLQGVFGDDACYVLSIREDGAVRVTE